MAEGEMTSAERAELDRLRAEKQRRELMDELDKTIDEKVTARLQTRIDQLDSLIEKLEQRIDAAREPAEDEDDDDDDDTPPVGREDPDEPADPADDEAPARTHPLFRRIGR